MNTIRDFSRALTLSLFAAFILALFVSCSASSELSGTYEGSCDGEPRTVTFMDGHAFVYKTPMNGGLQGTYKVEGKTIQGDVGIAKLNYQIIDDQTLGTTCNGRLLQLKKQP
jgi:hypothetical protein